MSGWQAIIVLAAQAQLFSPGELSPQHAELEGVRNCAKCHVSGSEVEAQLCLSCHSALVEYLRDARGLHGREAKPKGPGCQRCHVEHEGKAVPLVRWREGSAEKFDHTRSGYALLGPHRQTECRDCHATKNLDLKLLAGDETLQSAEARARTWLGLQTSCRSCHADEHRGQLTGSCERCHGQPNAWAPVASFDHDDARFSLRGAHARVDCARCHPREAALDNAVRYRPIAHSACTDCHEDVHAGAMGPSCTDCHDEDAFAPAHYDRASHAPKTFPLRGGHAEPACTSCHGGALNERAPTACASCHDDPHSGRFGQRCESCHNIEGWNRMKHSDRSFHDATRYPLTGLHQTVPCKDCHPGRGHRVEKFARCDDCHADAHDGQLVEDCESCHDTGGFTPASYGLSDHALTGFPLEGAHGFVGCPACHAPEQRTDVKGMSDWRFDETPPAECAACHQDVHGGQFEGAPTRGCDDCHAADNWQPVDFDHQRTEFPLDGAHTEADCARCHAQESGTRQFRGTSERCEDCHEDIHFAQFTKSEPVRPCTDCHTTTAFPISDFDHTEKTEWPLDGAHLRSECAACHPEVPVQVALAKNATQFRLGEQACADCHVDYHGDPEAIAAAKTPPPPRFGACERCHGTETWAELLGGETFDHAATGFALRGDHAASACADCHNANTLPRGENCAACHADDDPHDGALGLDCVRCHTDQGWMTPSTARSHDTLGFPLQGAHAFVECDACHSDADPQRFAGTPRQCDACHLSEALAAGVHPDHQAAGFTTRCDACHLDTRFAPASVDHDRWWPLDGAHRPLECFECHAETRYEGTPRHCAGCHDASEAAGATVAHDAPPLTDRCEQCHRTAAWVPTKRSWHDPFFPISRGEHRSLRNDCASCHPDSGNFALFTCTSCHEHSQPRMDREHRGIRNYRYDDQACLSCHPNGSE